MTDQQQVAIVTGGSSGIGLNATKKLVEKGIHCIIASRNLDRVNDAVEKIKSETGRNNIEGMVLDLCDFDSVKKFVEEFKAKNLPLNLLVNNAGLMTNTKELTKCGMESTFVANHLGHFLLTNLLLEKLKASSPSRIVVVASTMHDPTKGPGGKVELTLDTFNFDSLAYDATTAYRFSKLANIWFAYHLNKLLEGSGVTVNCICPGFIPETGLSRDFNFVLRWFLQNVLGYFVQTRTLDYGGDCVVDAATNPEITTGGKFYVDMKESTSSERSYNLEEQQKLWDFSVKAVGM